MVVTVVGLIALLVLRRDLTASYVVVIGVVIGIIAASISAPIAAGVFGGVTGAGSDFLVAAFRQGGADIEAATLGQAFDEDPIDKVVTFFTVYLISTRWRGGPRRASRRASSCSTPPRERRPERPIGGAIRGC